MTTENVVFTFDPQSSPPIRYRSTPSLCTGAAATLGEARAAYRADLVGLLQVERHELPPVIEHVEAVVHGMWVREKVGSVHRDCASDRMFLQTLLAPGAIQNEFRSQVEAAVADGVEPVVVLVDPDDPVGTVLDQMTPQDAVVVTYPDSHDGVGWAAIYGPQATGADQLPAAPADPTIREMPIDAFTQTYAVANDRRSLRVSPHPLSEAC